jgi:hypothetical protein
LIHILAMYILLICNSGEEWSTAANGRRLSAGGGNAHQISMPPNCRRRAFLLGAQISQPHDMHSLPDPSSSFPMVHRPFKIIIDTE